MGIFKPPMTMDDRGRETPLWAGAWGQSGEGSRQELPADVRARLMSGWSDPGSRGPGMLSLKVKVRGRTVALVLLWISVLIVGGIVIGMLGLPGVLLPILSGGTGVVFMAVYQGQTRKRFESMTRSTLLHEGYCAGCAYPLTALPVEADGCVVCPECRAAWRPVGVAALAERRGAASTGLWKPAVAKGWMHESRVLQTFTLGAFGHARLVTVQDASGKLVEVVRDGRELRRTPGWNELGEEEQRELLRAFRSRALSSRLVVLLGIGLFGLIAWAGLRAWMVAPPQWSLGYVGTTLKLAVLGLMMLALPLWLIRPPVWNRGEQADVLRSRGLCPRCASRLDLDGSGCRVCGAVWKGLAGAGDSGASSDAKRP